jgi:hypothetical protein
VTSQTDGPAFVKTAEWGLIGICFAGCVKSSPADAPCDGADEATLYLCAGSAIVDGGVADLLNKEGICFRSEFFGKGFAFLFEAFEADFQELMQVQLLFEGGEELRGGSGFAEFEDGFEELGAAFEVAEAWFGHE